MTECEPCAGTGVKDADPERPVSVCPVCGGSGGIQAAVNYPECVFCDYSGPSLVTWPNPKVYMIEPLNPVAPGHKLFIPKAHFDDASEGPWEAAHVFAIAAQWAEAIRQPFNLITSGGRVATQSVFHFHLHYIPRREGDGLLLPWSKVFLEPDEKPERYPTLEAPFEEDRYEAVKTSLGRSEK